VNGPLRDENGNPNVVLGCTVLGLLLVIVILIAAMFGHG